MTPRRGPLLALALGSTLAAQATAPAVDPQGIAGTLFLAGGGQLAPDVLARFVELAGGSQGRLVLIPTASADADADSGEESLADWRARGLASVVRLHTRDRTAAEQPGFVAALDAATAVWIGGGDQGRLAATYLGTAVERALLALLARGGVVGGTSAGTAVQSRLMITGGRETATTGEGFDHLPGVVLDQHFTARARQGRLAGVLGANPGHVGIGVDEGTAVVVRGRRLEVLGAGRAHVLLAAGSGRPAMTQELKAGAIADLVALRRAAIERTKPPFPPPEAQRVGLPAGALVAAGGGRLPAEVLARFVELAGGVDAPIVVLPTAVADPDDGPRRSPEADALARAGARDVTVRRERGSAVAGEPFVQALRRARGVWFGGGRQWRFVDAYEGTIALELFADVLRRGGVIGGSSAGATIQAAYLVRGHPLGNETMMAEGYERGFAFLPGCAIDQHFTQRRRERDLAAVVARHPQLLGIGIDEGTALVVQGDTATVLGTGGVHFFDQGAAHAGGTLPPLRLVAGEAYDLARRARR